MDDLHVGFGLGLFDKRGVEIKCGDQVLHLNESGNTKPEYWYPVYRIVWRAPCFVAEYTGGGKASDLSFTLRHYPSNLLVLGGSSRRHGGTRP
jgi:hypothetical protein